MAEIFRTRVIRPSTRQAKSTNYRVDVKKVLLEDRLTVKITHESTDFHKKFVFNGTQLAEKATVSFRVLESNGNIKIIWSRVEPDCEF